MAQNELAKKVSSLVDLSMSRVKASMDKLHVEELINLSAAVDQQDQSAVRAILDQAQPETQLKLTAQQTLREINRMGKDLLKKHQPLDKVWELIGNTNINDWKIMWPAIDQDIMISLYVLAADQETDSISADQAAEIHDYGQDFVTESHVIYRNQLCEVTVPRGPSHTLGINYLGKTKMVSRSEVQKIQEHVLGMTQMPHLGRMMELAGIGSTPSVLDHGMTEDHLLPTPHVIVQLDVLDPYQTRVKVPNLDGTTTLKGLQLRINRLQKELQAQINKSFYDHAEHTCERLKNSLYAMRVALDYLDTQTTLQEMSSENR